MTSVTKILQVADILEAHSKKIPSKELSALENASSEVGRSWSGSWLGYHSRVYYADLKPVPPGARFSIDLGLMQGFRTLGTIGEWAEYEFKELKDEIIQRAGIHTDSLTDDANKTKIEFEDCQGDLLSLITPISNDHERDAFLQDILSKIQKMQVFSYNYFIQVFKPKGQQMSRDMPAIQAGFEIPPHIAVLAEMCAIKSPYDACERLSKLARRAASHIENITKKEISSERIGTNVFIGHGQSKVWRDLKDFVQDRLHLPYDEFNRVPVAGFTNIARLSEMLNNAAVAFIVLTAEDELADGKFHARMNVIHEAGLFQGRLGFEKAILLLEEGCEEFSNVQGLGQIRFPTGDIAAKFEEIRRVLEREGLVEYIKKPINSEIA